MRVLLAMDLDRQHRALFDEAARWVRRMNAELDLLYVLPFTPMPSIRDPELLAALEAEMRSDTTQVSQLQELLNELEPQHRGNVTARSGTPAEEILDASRDYDAVIVGTHGRTGMKRLWLGSVAEKVIRAATVPVVVLPLRAMRPEGD